MYYTRYHAKGAHVLFLIVSHLCIPTLLSKQLGCLFFKNYGHESLQTENKSSPQYPVQSRFLIFIIMPKRRISSFYCPFSQSKQLREKLTRNQPYILLRQQQQKSYIIVSTNRIKCLNSHHLDSGKKCGIWEASSRKIMTFHVQKYIRHSGKFVGNVKIFPGHLHFFQPDHMIPLLVFK